MGTSVRIFSRSQTNKGDIHAHSHAHAPHVHIGPSSRVHRAERLQIQTIDERDWQRSLERASKTSQKQSKQRAVGTTPGQSASLCPSPASPLTPDFDHLFSTESSTTHTHRSTKQVQITDWRPFGGARKTDIVSPLPLHTLARHPYTYTEDTQMSDSRTMMDGGDDTDRTVTSSRFGHDSSRGTTFRGPERVFSDSQMGRPLTAHARHEPPSVWRRWALRSPMARRTIRYMQSRTYLIINVIITLFAFFAYDFSVALLPKAADVPMLALLCCVLGMFLAEMIVAAALRRNYLGTFIFFLDVLGTASLVVDVLLLAWLDRVASSSKGSAGSVIHTYAFLREDNIARAFRVVRLVRIVRIFNLASLSAAWTHRQRRLNGGRGGGCLPDRASTPDTQPSKMGLHLSELIDKRVIFMILVLVVIMPYLRPLPTSDQSLVLGFDLLQQQTVGSADWAATISTIMAYHSDSLLYLACGADASTNPTVYVGDPNAGDGMRTIEKDAYSSSRCIAMTSQSGLVGLEAGLNLLFMLVIIIIFGVGSYLISKDVASIIVTPLARMSNAVRRLASSIRFCQTDIASFRASDSEGLLGDEEDEDDAFDPTAIESIIDKLSLIFRVQPDASTWSTEGGSKGLAQLAGSKSTEIRTADSVVSIEVVERPRAPSIDLSSLLAHRPSADQPPIDTDEHKELASLNNILNHPTALKYFKAYLKNSFLMENMAFYEEVDRYRTIVQLHASRLYSGFVSSHSASQINIPGHITDRIIRALPNPSASTFDEAQSECFSLMKSHHQHFLKSIYGFGYVKNKRKQARPSNTQQTTNTTNTLMPPAQQQSNATKSDPTSGVTRGAPSPLSIHSSGSMSLKNGDGSPGSVPILTSPPRTSVTSMSHNRTSSRMGVNRSTLPVMRSAHGNQSSMSRKYIPGQTETDHFASLPGSIQPTDLDTLLDDLDEETRALVLPGSEVDALVNPGRNKKQHYMRPTHKPNVSIDASAPVTRITITSDEGNRATPKPGALRAHAGSQESTPTSLSLTSQLMIGGGHTIPGQHAPASPVNTVIPSKPHPSTASVTIHTRSQLTSAGASILDGSDGARPASSSNANKSNNHISAPTSTYHLPPTPTSASFAHKHRPMALSPSISGGHTVHPSRLRMTLSPQEMEAESLRLMLPGGARGATSNGRTGVQDLDEEIDRLVNPGAEMARLVNPSANKPNPIQMNRTPRGSNASMSEASSAAGRGSAQNSTRGSVSANTNNKSEASANSSAQARPSSSSTA